MKHLKKILFIIILNSITCLAHAEYNGWFIEFEATEYNDRRSKGYVYLASAYFDEDSLNNDHYLIRKFDNIDWRENDTIIYFKELVKYLVITKNKKDTIYDYTTIHKDKLIASKLKSLKITNRIRYSYINSMSILNTSGNLNWLNCEPVMQVSIYGYLCDRIFYIHKKSKTTDKIIAAIKEFETRYEKEKQEIQKILDNADGEQFVAAEERMKKLVESRDEVLWELEKMLEGEKVVVRGSCTC